MKAGTLFLYTICLVVLSGNGTMAAAAQISTPQNAPSAEKVPATKTPDISGTTSDAATPVIPKPLNVLPSKIKPVQSGTDELSKAAPENKGAGQDSSNSNNTTNLETLSPRSNFGFGVDFWTHSSHEQITEFLSQPEAVTPTRAVRDLALRAVMTPANNMSSDNLYALRIQRLVNLGDFEDAMTLYKMNEGDPPSPFAARAGIESILTKGEMGVTCLEEKALNDTFKTDTPAFWNNLNTLCQALLSPTAGDDATLRLQNASRIYLEAVKVTPPTTVEALNKLDSVSTIALTKTGKLNGLITPSTMKSVSDKKLGILISFMDESSPAKLPILAEGLRRGLINGESTPTLLQKIVFTGSGKNKTPSADEKFVKAYLGQTPPIATPNLLTMAATNPVYQMLLIPFYVQGSAYPTTGASQAKLGVKLLTIANQNLPPNLVATALSIPPISPTEAENSGEKLLYTTLANRTNQATEPAYSLLLAMKPVFDGENVNKNVYDNILNLTAKYNYVMPNAEILSSLKQAAEQKQADQAIVNSLKLLTGTTPENLHPAALLRIFEALNSAGLTEETLSLSRDALGTLLEK